jgi:DNA repair photolyase
MQYVRENEFHVSKMNNYYLEKIIEEAEKRGITVFICFPPIIKELYDDNIGNEHLSLCRSFLEGVASSRESVILLTKDFYVVTADKLLNSIDHLNREESLVYTDLLAEKILQFTDKGR